MHGAPTFHRSHLEICRKVENRKSRAARLAEVKFDIDGKWARQTEEDRRVVSRGMSRILSEIVHLQSSPHVTRNNESRKHRLSQKMSDFIYFCTYNGRWSTMCNVHATVLITRMFRRCPTTFNSKNWKQVILVALMIAQKFNDDVPLVNSDFGVLWVASGAKKTAIDVNRLEHDFMKHVSFDVFVKNSSYWQTHYYIRRTARAPEFYWMGREQHSRLLCAIPENEDSVDEKSNAVTFAGSMTPPPPRQTETSCESESKLPSSPKTVFGFYMAEREEPTQQKKVANMFPSSFDGGLLDDWIQPVRNLFA
jgi:hypothetical protein